MVHLADRPGQGKIVGGMKILARLIYQLVVCILAPLGILYHFAQALKYKLQGKVELGWEHCKAAYYDLYCIIAPNMFFLFPAESAASLCSDSLVRLKDSHNRNGMDRGLELTGAGSYPKEWAFHQYSFASFEYRYSALVQLSLEKGLGCADARVLREIQQRAWSCLPKDHYFVYRPLTEVRRPYIAPSTRPVDAQDEYTFPWASVAMLILGLGLVAIGIMSKFYLPSKVVGAIGCAVYVFMGIHIAYFGFQTAYRDNRGYAELSAGSKRHSEYWYSKALQRGYEPAQRAYGFFLLMQHHTKEGMDWIHAAAANGDQVALGDLEVLIRPNFVPPLPGSTLPDVTAMLVDNHIAIASERMRQAPIEL
jgi:hypothetical protein